MLTFERVEEIFEEVDSDWNGDNALKGLIIIASVVNDNKDVLVAAEHDIIYSIDVEEAIEYGMTEEQFTELAKLNWMIEDGCYLACYV